MEMATFAQYSESPEKMEFVPLWRLRATVLNEGFWGSGPRLGFKGLGFRV